MGCKGSKVRILSRRPFILKEINGLHPKDVARFSLSADKRVLSSPGQRSCDRRRSIAAIIDSKQHQGVNVPIELLNEIARTPLPAFLVDQAQIDKARVLRASGLIQAMLPEENDTGPAVVHAITRLGLIALGTEEDPNPV